MPERAPILPTPTAEFASRHYCDDDDTIPRREFLAGPGQVSETVVEFITVLVPISCINFDKSGVWRGPEGGVFSLLLRSSACFPDEMPEKSRRRRALVNATPL